MAVTLRPLGNVDIEALIPLLKEILSDLEDQLNTRAQVYVSTDGKVPTNLQRNDVLISVSKGKIQLLVRGRSEYAVLTAPMIGGLNSKGMNFLGTISKAGAPSLADFPNKGDFGYYHKTNATVTYFHCVNINGVLKTTTLT